MGLVIPRPTTLEARLGLEGPERLKRFEEDVEKRREWVVVGRERSKGVKIGRDKGIFIASKESPNARVLVGSLCDGLCYAEPQKSKGSRHMV